MENNIEEDIKILENMNDGYTFKDCDICNNYNEKTKCCDKHKCMELQAIEHILRDYKRVLKENEELKERNEYYISKSVIQDKIEEIINNSTFGCVGCEWNDIEVVQLLENMLLDRKDK